MRLAYDLLDPLEYSGSALILALTGCYPKVHQSVFVQGRKNRKKIETLPGALFEPDREAKNDFPWLRKEAGLVFKLAEERTDILFCPGPRLTLRQPCKTAVLIPDLDHMIFPEHGIRGLENRIRWSIQKTAVKKSNRILTYSSFCANHISRLLEVAPSKIAKIPAAADGIMAPVYDRDLIERTKKENGISGAYLIFAGGSSKKKNLNDLAEILKLFPDLPNLVVSAEVDEELKRQLAGARLIFTGFKNRTELAVLYSGAIAYVTASSYEGFPWGAFEAMCCGTPSVAYDNSSFGEILGGSCLLAENSSKSSLAAAIKKICRDRQLRLKLQALSLERARTFSPEQAAKEAMEVFSSIHKESYFPDEK